MFNQRLGVERRLLAGAVLALTAGIATEAAAGDEESKARADDSAESDEASSKEGATDESPETGVPVEAATASQKRVAAKQFQLGIQLYKAEQLERALDLFRMSLSRVDSPNSRLMAARCLAKLERYPEAYREFERVIVEAEELARAIEKYEGTADAAKTELEQVKQKVAIVHLQSEGRVSVNGEALEGAHPPLVLEPGEALFVLESSDGRRSAKSIQLEAGTERTVDLDLPVGKIEKVLAPRVVAQRDDPDTVSKTTLGYVSLGVTGLGVAGFVGFGLLDRHYYEELQDRCVNGQCPDTLRDDAERGRLYQTLANVSLGVGVVSAVTATYMFLSSGGKQEEARAKKEGDDEETQAASVVVGLGSLFVRGKF